MNSTAFFFLIAVEQVVSCLGFVFAIFDPQIHCAFVIRFLFFHLEILTIFSRQIFAVTLTKIWYLLLEVYVVFALLFFLSLLFRYILISLKSPQSFFFRQLLYRFFRSKSLSLKFLWSSYCCLICSSLALFSSGCSNICSSLSDCLWYGNARELSKYLPKFDLGIFSWINSSKYLIYFGEVGSKTTCF